MQTDTSSRDTEYQSLRGLMKTSEDTSVTAGLLAAAIEEELTERQAEMVRLYYIQQRTMRDVAALLGVNPSTVSRTLKAARAKLKRCLRYSSRSFLREEL